MTCRHLILRVVVPAITVAAVVAPGASAMPRRDVDAAGAHAMKMHHDVRPPALVDAIAHADTMRRIGARLAAQRRV
jgi:hypothetical protein